MRIRQPNLLEWRLKTWAALSLSANGFLAAQAKAILEFDLIHRWA
jgi:hypothetical protein